MNGSAQINTAAYSAGITPASRHVIPSDLQPPVFSPAVRFAPQELSPSQVIRLIAHWVVIRVAIIAIALVMARSGVSYLGHVWSERPAYHSVK
jgi:hypothetical protein